MYHFRWDEEKVYKLLKTSADFEEFSDKIAIIVKQDFFAKIILMSLCVIYAYSIEKKVREEYKADVCRKQCQQINHTYALSFTPEVTLYFGINNYIYFR